MAGSRSRSTLLIALAVASAAALAAYLLLGRLAPPAPPAAPVVTPEPTAGVLVAARDLAAGEAIDADAVSVARVPVDLKHPRALSDPSQAVGRTAAVALVAGEQILETRLGERAGTGARTFAEEVPVGKRAVSVVFDEVIGAGGLVQPGDRVDVIAYLEIEVDDPSIQGKDWQDVVDDAKATAAAETRDADQTDAGAGGASAASFDDLLTALAEKDYDYKQYVATYVLQDVEVLAVAQALSPEEAGLADAAAEPTASPEPTAEGEGGNAGSAADAPPAPPAPVARPEARSVTLAVTPEQAQRLFLAVRTVESEQGGLRLAMRAPGDTTTFDLRPAQLGDIPLGNLLGDVDRPMVPRDLVITEARFRERALDSGDLLEFEATVKNISQLTLRAGSQGAAPGFTYAEDEAFDSLGYFAQSPTYRIGLNFAGAAPRAFPYRWDLGRDLAPGESTTIEGAVRLTEETAGTRWWLGVIMEPNVVTQDGVAVAEIVVNPAAAVRVVAPEAPLRAEPAAEAEVLLAVNAGTELKVRERRDGWYRVRVGETEGWVAAADVETVHAAPTATPAAPGASPVPAATPVAGEGGTP